MIILLVWTLAVYAIRKSKDAITPETWGVNPSDDGIANTFALVGTTSGAYISIPIHRFEQRALVRRNHHVLFEACQQTTRDGL
jgi:hypothetical protein